MRYPTPNKNLKSKNLINLDEMKDCPIFVSSTDLQDDIWPVFFDLFKKHWPEYDGVIYLNTEEKSFHCEGLNIVCTRVGRFGNFGNIFRAGLERVESDTVLLMMIDYIFMGKVNDLKMKEYYNYFCASELDSLCLTHQDYRELRPSGFPDVEIVLPPSPNMFSYQIAFWNRDMLYNLVLSHENYPSSEWFGVKRANKMKIKLGCLTIETDPPILYDLEGCFKQDRWLANAIDYLWQIDYYVNIKKRGCYRDLPFSISNDLFIRWMLMKDGLKGSYWDLMKRKAITTDTQMETAYVPIPKLAHS